VIPERVRRALKGNWEETRPGHPDRRLRGRTYAIPYDRVWREALRLAVTRRTWEIERADDREGVIEAVARTPVFRFSDDVEIRIGLDENAQTRVDLRSASRKGSSDLGTNARRIARFLKHLDKRLEPHRPKKPKKKKAEAG